ncbi:MAG: hypothetical protein K8T25_18435 [Planctomycetia bacterium]|nr:hypothetical protein [Planctomycetia bacterium]
MRNVLRRVICSAVMAATCSSIWIASSAVAEQPKSPAAAGKINLKYTQPGFAAAVILKPRRMLDSPLAKGLPPGDIEKQLKQALPDLPISLRQVEELQVFVGPPPAGADRELLVSIALVVRLTADADRQQLVAQFENISEPAECAGKKYTRIKGHIPGGYFFADDGALVIGDEESICEILKTSGPPSPLLEILSRIDSRHDVVAAGVMAPFRQMAAEAAKNAGQKLPPQLQAAAGLPNQIKLAALTFDLAGNHLLTLTLEGNDRAGTAELAKNLIGARDFLKLIYGAKRPEIEQNFPPESRAAAMRLLDELVTGVEVNPDGPRVVLSLRTPAGWANLPATLRPILERLHPPADGANPQPIPIAGPAARRPARGELRLWINDTGEHHLEAQLIAVDGPNVRLKRKDGKVIAVPLDKLSAADQEYVKAAGSGNDQ